MNYEQVKELISMIDQSSLKDFELNIDNVSVKMSKNGASPIVTTPVGTPSVEFAPMPVQPVVSTFEQQSNKKPEMIEGNIVTSPIVGTFYASGSPEKPPYVKKGDHVKQGDILCVIEAMKIMNEIVSQYTGEVAEILVNNEDLVEYGQPLFKIV